MAEQLSLDDVLGEKEPPEIDRSTETSPPPEPNPDRVRSSRAEFRQKELDARADGEGQVRDPETGKFAPKEAKEPEQKVEVKEPEKTEAPKTEVKTPAEPEWTPREKAAFAKAADETRKRQELERKLAEYQQANQPAPKPFAEDPDGALKQHQETTRNDVLTTKLQMADMLGEMRYPDYAQKRDIFMKICEAQPQHVAQMLQSPNPAVYAYNIAKQALDMHELQQAGGVQALVDKRLADEKKKWEAEAAEKAKTQEKERKDEAERLPGTLSNVRAIGGSNRPAWGGPQSLDEILK